MSYTKRYKKIFTILIALMTFTLCFRCSTSPTIVQNGPGTEVFVKGRVVYQDSSVVKNAHIELQENKKDGIISINTFSDENGHFLLGKVQTGTYVLHINDQDSSGLIKELRINTETYEPDDTVDINTEVVSRLSSISGTVSAQGPTTKVSLLFKDITFTFDITDAQGHYSLRNIPEGSYDLLYTPKDSNYSQIVIPNLRIGPSQDTIIDDKTIPLKNEVDSSFYDDTISIRKILDANDTIIRISDRIKKSDKGVIISLDLSDLNLDTLPDDIGDLSHLEHLDVSRNNLSYLPDNIQRCKNLTEIDADYNVLEEFSPQLLQCLHLEEISMMHNQINFLPDSIGYLTNLYTLNLNYNNLSELPPSFSSLTNIKYLEISDNKISSLPINIHHLTQLDLLNLSSNNLDNLPNDFYKLPAIKHLFIKDNKFKNLPDSMITMNTLENFIFENNYLCNVSSTMSNWLRTFSYDWNTAQYCSDQDISITNPKNEDTLSIGDTIIIQWERLYKNSDILPVNISFSPDSGLSWLQITKTSISTDKQDWGNYKWIIPEYVENGDKKFNTISNKCVIMISYYGNSNDIVAKSEGVFTITP